jgi:hypothetical protein
MVSYQHEVAMRVTPRVWPRRTKPAAERPGHHPFGSVAFDSGRPMGKYEIGRGTFTIGFAEGSA